MNIRWTREEVDERGSGRGRRWVREEVGEEASKEESKLILAAYVTGRAGPISASIIKTRSKWSLSSSSLLLVVHFWPSTHGAVSLRPMGQASEPGPSSSYPEWCRSQYLSLSGSREAVASLNLNGRRT